MHFRQLHGVSTPGRPRVSAGNAAAAVLLDAPTASRAHALHAMDGGRAARCWRTRRSFLAEGAPSCAKCRAPCASRPCSGSSQHGRGGSTRNRGVSLACLRRRPRRKARPSTLTCASSEAARRASRRQSGCARRGSLRLLAASRPRSLGGSDSAALGTRSPSPAAPDLATRPTDRGRARRGYFRLRAREGLRGERGAARPGPKPPPPPAVMWRRRPQNPRSASPSTPPRSPDARDQPAQPLSAACHPPCPPPSPQFGAHVLSGCVLDPRPLDELLPSWRRAPPACHPPAARLPPRKSAALLRCDVRNPVAVPRRRDDLRGDRETATPVTEDRFAILSEKRLARRRAPSRSRSPPLCTAAPLRGRARPHPRLRSPPGASA